MAKQYQYFRKGGITAKDSVGPRLPKAGPMLPIIERLAVKPVKMSSPQKVLIMVLIKSRAK